MSGITTRIESVSLPVADQDAAIRFYVDVLGFELVKDSGGPAQKRWVEVAMPGDPVSIILLAPDSELPIALRLCTPDADQAYRRVQEGGGVPQQPEVLRFDWAPPMFTFTDPDGNLLDYIEN